MKIITNNNILYVPKIDLDFLNYQLHYLPSSISWELIDNKEVNIDDLNKYDFIKFTKEENIRFFNSIDWIIDYNAIECLSILEVKKLGHEYIKKLEIITKELYEINSFEDNYKNILFQYKVLQYQISSLNDIIDFKSGLLEIILPPRDNKILSILHNFFRKNKLF